MEFMCKSMKYGFTYRNKVFTDTEPDFQENMNKFYKIRLGEDFLKSGYGVCWDFCEFERDFFEYKKIPYECFFFEAFVTREGGGPTHTFLLFSRNGKWFWFEFAWQFHRGIWEFNTKEDAIESIKKKFVEFFNKDFSDVKVFKTNKVTKRLNAFEFVDFCYKGKRVE